MENNQTALTIREKYLPGNRAALEAMAEHTNAIYEMVRMHDNSPLTAIAIANAVQQLRESITPELIQGLKKLQGSPLGFQTDKDNGAHIGRGKYEPGTGYDDDTVRDVAIMAASKGARMYGNEVNIIKSRMYLTKQYYGRLLDDTLGRHNWHTTPDIPRDIGEKRAVVSGTIWWRDSDGEHTDTCQFSVKCDATSTIDLLIGNWVKRARQMIYERSTGVKAPDDHSDDGVIDTTSETVAAQEIKAEKQFEDGEEFISENDQRELVKQMKQKCLTPEEASFILWEDFGYKNSAEIRKCDLGKIRTAFQNAVHGSVIP